MKIRFEKAAVAGIAGTIAFDVLGFLVTGKFWDIPSILSAKLIGDGGLVLGVLAHYSIGVILAVIYAGLAPSLWGNRWVRSLTYITAQTVFGVWFFMMPLLGIGIMGLKAGALVPVIALLRHWAYGLVVAWLYPLEEERETRPVRRPVREEEAAVRAA
jgi:hypothetical protein